MQSSKTARPKPPNWPPQSSHTVLIRNLQLLELDRLEDWPGVTPRTLSSSSQNQRQRLKVTEWILYRLIALWDPETARDKLRPFFPPLEPLQSVNLRAALFRVLSDLKKNGDLGRETILRKSMLDDCKGEKFDELLAVLSTNVVRKKKVHDRTHAIYLSLASGLTPQEYPLLLPLILAHRVSLKTLGGRRDRVRDTHEKFFHLLERKKHELDARSTSDSHALHMQEVGLEALGRETKVNWQGNPEWTDAILYGGLNSGRDTFLELPFDSAWSQAKKSTVDDLCITASRPDLVTDLETRVLQQRARMQRWHQYTASFKRPGAALPSKPTGRNKTPPLVFRDHQSLTIASISKAVRQPVERGPPIANNRNLLHSISEAMERINSPPSRQRTPPTSITEPEPEPKRNLSRPIPTITRPEIFEPPKHSLDIPPAEITAYEYPTEQSFQRRPRQPYTLTERTRKSMSMSLVEEVPESPDNYPTFESPTEQPTEQPPEQLFEQEPRRSYTLLERTRKSMSLLPPRELPRLNPSSRKSRVSLPVNQFESPTKSSATDFPSRASTPRDDLFEDQADYASVFKSRPRIALSPVVSPAVHISPIGDFDLSADVGSGDAEEDLDYVAVGSPLASRGRY
ncbi:HAUS augmin-like complex subunit 6 N-terminus-domain-containing protein [Aspergillus cavernicola]|uniref:HAUS augmin-like complex subunit 6 N-terminus-domain-containing protein n=1 Tax=Aspergillus cavernicola TaxID=176166 RepID=A0ABR4IYQ9_9EURO